MGVSQLSCRILYWCRGARLCAKFTFLYSFPQSRGVLFRQTHDSFCGAVSYKIRFFHTVDEGIIHHHPIRIQTNEILVRPVAEMNCQTPGQGGLCGFIALSCCLRRRVCPCIEVKEQANRVVPFQRNTLKGEPTIMRLRVRLNQ